MKVYYRQTDRQTFFIFGKMKKVWANKRINLQTKLRLYEALILSTLLYSAELWPLTVTLSKKLEAATTGG